MLKKMKQMKDPVNQSNSIQEETAKKSQKEEQTKSKAQEKLQKKIGKR